MARGTLIVLEGAEGVGKSTQIERLVHWLRDRHLPHVALREPGGTALGESIRHLLLDPGYTLAPATEALLFMASRAQIVAERIRPALDRGEVVVLDRFFLSTYAYQIYGRGLDESLVRGANQLAVGDLKPDLTVILDLPAGEGLTRAGARGTLDRIESANAEFHHRVSTAFATFASTDWQHAHPECGPIARLQASGTPDDVFTRLLVTLAKYCPDSFANEVPSFDL
jgi:dTMP kinase